MNEFNEKSTNTENNIAEETIVKNKKNTFDLKKEVFEWIYTIVVALVIAFFIKAFIFDIVRVDGPSMNPTLIHNDRLIITKLGYEPESGDIVILDSTYKNRENYYKALEENGEGLNKVQKAMKYFSLPDSLKKRYYVKRVIALPGQTVDIKDGKVYVDDMLLEEEYYDGITTRTDSAVEYPVTVEDDCIFVMGDNRPESLDSRSQRLGQVPIEAVLGKAQIRLFPVSKFGFVD